MATALRLTAEACPSMIRPTRELVAEVAREHGLSERRARDVKLCVHEAIANVSCHAYKGRPGPVDVTVQDLGDVLAVAVSDHGAGAPSRICNPSAMGLRLMSHLSTRCTVRAHDDGMEVEMVFQVPSPTPRSEPPPVHRDTRLLHF
jgi:serine/threonine-protein kinase RsbW